MAKKQQLVSDYRRARANALARVRRARRAGYSVDIRIPKIPKRVTQKSIDYINRVLSSENIRKKSVWRSIYFDVEFKGTERKKIRQQMKREREIFSDEGEWGGTGKEWGDPGELEITDDEGRTIISNLLYEFSKLNQQRAYEVLEEWLRGFSFTMGYAEAGRIIEESANKGIVPTVTIEDSERKAVEKTKRYIRQLMEISGEYSDERVDEIMNEIEFI